MKHNKKIISAVLACISVGCIIAAVAIGIYQMSESRHSANVLDELRDSAEALKNVSPEPVFPDSSVSPTPSPDVADPGSTPAPTATPEPIPTEPPGPVPVLNPYSQSFLANEDMAAWLQIPGTNVDYPVMWTPRDEEYYLRRGFDGSKDQAGCLILDTDSSLDPLTTNLIIHGHNMDNGTMFGHLADYVNAKYCEEHKNIILYTETVQRNYEVIAVFRSQVFKKSDQVFKFYKFFQADTQAEFDDFYKNIKAMSLYDIGVTAEFGDRFITLSTCSYHVENGRFVVVAKEVESGDVYLPLKP